MVELYTGEVPFHPANAKSDYDRLGRYVRRHHQIIAEHSSTPEGNRVWEVRCERCRHGYITSGPSMKSQACRCDQRGTR